MNGAVRGPWHRGSRASNTKFAIVSASDLTVHVAACHFRANSGHADYCRRGIGRRGSFGSLRLPVVRCVNGAPWRRIVLPPERHQEALGNGAAKRKRRWVAGNKTPALIREAFKFVENKSRAFVGHPIVQVQAQTSVVTGSN